MLPLPPRCMRLGGPKYRNDDYYISSALSEVHLLQNYAGLKNGINFLDFGCGVGRLANGLDQSGVNVSYWGIDVREKSINWCVQNLAREGFRFTLSSAHNERYRPKGHKHWKIAIVDHSFDVIYAHSVFSHMLPESTVAYLLDFKRLLSEGGRIYLTAFLEPNVPDCVENPTDYGNIKWRGRLHCVRYNLNYFTSLVNAAGLMAIQYHHGTHDNGQSGLLLKANNESHDHK